MDGYEKIRFRLEPNQAGWPPYETEGLWAVPLGGELYRLDNIPFFARGVSCDDVVRARPDPAGHLWADVVERRGGHSTIRVIAGEADERLRAREALIVLGCAVEGFGRHGLLAVDCPPGVDMPAVQALLAAGEAAGRWGYEESDLSGHRAKAGGTS